MNIIQPRKALNKAWLKVKPVRSEIETFKSNLVRLIGSIDNAKDEEFHKTEVRDFLRNTWYQDKYYFNVKHNIDWAIGNGPKAGDTVGVLIETKKPANKGEMISRDNINKKALHELILYYLRERITCNNLEIKHIVATNIYEWFIFDAAVFEKLFAENKTLVRLFRDFEEGRLSGSGTDFFYNKVAEPEVAKILNSDTAEKLEFTWFDIRDYEKPLRNKDKQDDNKLIVLFKLLSPEHLLKLPFANDSNSLDKSFYAELLHIIGLSETKEGNKKVIGRRPAGKRDAGSLLENTIVQLENLDKISRLSNPSQYGANYEERLFNVALELSITWVNRILFLKLLEAQLIAYHNGDKGYSFLNFEKVRDYDDLNSLFFSVLARKPENRPDELKNKFAHVPYLNSSLFEVSEVEDKTIVVSNLKDELTLPVLSSTVLKDANGKRRTGNLNALQYFFEFLDAYDFSGEGAEEIQEDNKTLINASVLGLIFEKINGYKDGSFFTPGFITMYMCRETIRRAVVEKFNEENGWKCNDFDSLYNKIEDKKEANAVINSLKICDPAVGSGHFLVSALNEIIAIKSELKILCDREGRTLRDYHVEVVNDEMAITGEEGQPFKYNPNNRESQRVQEALFHEKQQIIENCLFGVDINPNSVKICRLRLWIELLKHAYYMNEEKAGNSSPVCYAGAGGVREEFMPIRQLQTLPNIDINIKCGNSLISRFDLDADISAALKKSKWTIDSYRSAVQTYREAANKEEKREMERLIADIKSDFESEISKKDKRLLRLNKAKGELFNLTNQQSLFGMSDKEKKVWEKQVEKLAKEIDKLETEIEEIKSNKIYENAFEWRFEFPEVLDDEGNFRGFDVVIGNPPYIRQEEIKELSGYLFEKYHVYSGKADLFVYFFERAFNILENSGYLTFITSGKYWEAGYGKELSNFIVNNSKILTAVNYNDLEVFDGITAYPFIIQLKKIKTSKRYQFNYYDFHDILPIKQDIYLNNNIPAKIDNLIFQENDYKFIDTRVSNLINKLYLNSSQIEDLYGLPIVGIKTGYNEGYITLNAHSNYVKPYIFGRDIKKYSVINPNSFIIFPYEQDFSLINLAEDSYVKELLEAHKKKLSERAIINEGLKKGSKVWYEYQQVNKSVDINSEYIVYPNVSLGCNFTLSSNCLVDMTGFIIKSNSKYLLSILNSKLVEFLMNIWSISRRGGYKEYKVQYIKRIPIKQVSSEYEPLFGDKVDQIYYSKVQNPNADTSSLEAEIDLMVYKLYGLTWEDVRIVDSEFGMGKEEYEKLEVV